MLKMKDLVAIDDTARLMLKKHWGFSEKALENTMFWRASANIIYRLIDRETTYYLRITPINERVKDEIEEEIRFIKFLRQQGFPANEVIGHLISDQGYYAVLFKSVEGPCLEDIEPSIKTMKSYGVLLARLHDLSSNYRPQKPRSYDMLLDRIISQDSSENITAIALELKQKLRQLQGQRCMIHHDFELDNVHFNQQSNKWSVIDFDDHLYGFVAHDVLTALNAIREEYPASDELFVNAFLDGYKTVNPSLDIDMAWVDLFSNFDDLLKFSRIQHCLSAVPQEKEPWMEGLMDYLQSKLDDLEKKLN